MDHALQNLARDAEHVRLEHEIAVQNDIAETLDPDVQVGRGLIAHRQEAQ
jgi:hypothetical protein